MIASFAEAMVSVKLVFAVWAGEPESVTLNVSGVVFTAVIGFPLIKPVDEFSVRPLGSVPDVSAQL